jgi:capsid protein
MQININIRNPFKKKPVPETKDEKATPSAMYGDGGYSGNNRAYAAVYDGQNSLGEMGPIVRYNVDHGALTLRSWQLYLESNNYKTIHKKLKDTVVGAGLTLQCKPAVKYLEKKGYKIDLEKFNEDVEELWNICANSTMFDYAGMRTLGELHGTGYLNSIVGGDVLVILRPINNIVKVQLVDGANVQTPISFPTVFEAKINYEPIERINPDTGNRVRWGIEIDATGKHVAYWVRVGYGLEYERIAARGAKSGALLAYMLTDEEFRIDNLRALPRMTAGMETASQMSRYKSATVSAAEEIAKSPYYIYHKENTDDSDPRMGNITKAFDVDRPANTQLNYSAEGKAIANSVSASTNRMVVNGTPGMELRSLESKNNLHFEPFNKALIEEQAALAGIPPEIVASKFDSNFSASRAAFLAEGMRLSREWNKQGNHFLQPIFNLQLDIWVQQFEVDAPGYIDALRTNNMYVLNAYRACVWTGQKLGHIDPLKEVKYWREVMGAGSEHIPFGTQQQAAAALDLGDGYANMSQYAKEMEEAEELGIQQQDKLTEDDTDDNDSDEVDDPPPNKGKKK